ncbi:MAG TPA: alpha-(1-_3)-arabinofuranosyltransferase family protein, partial [Marmoricola sp.]|nr:alpha-(1->3)-arabinofuranosyltransferase family protein [Marmoricola sp.]
MRGRLGRRLSRWEEVSPLHWGVMGFLVLGSLLQEPGKTTFDTKFDLTADPIAMLGRSLHLWNSSQNFGGVGDQAYGYLFPQGPWFVLGHVLGSPDWITQRLWSAVVLLIAYTGARRLAYALGIGARRGPIVVGLAYALSPRLFALAGVLSGEVLPTAVLPWICLPLVLGVQGRISPRRAGLLAGVAFLFVGGVNAVEDLAILPLPLFIVLFGSRSGAGRRLTAWWAGATAAASCWWLLPLVVLGKYSPPFLDYVETSATTT